MMTKISKTLLLFIILITFSSCEVIGGIFKAGMGVGAYYSNRFNNL